ncbi:DUF5522 domain-containing protein [Chryseobacterium sp. T1]
MPKIDIKENEDFYYNEDGYRVFTAKFHLKRGYCCKNGCRHCPYGYDKKTDTFIKDKKNLDQQ